MANYFGNLIQRTQAPDPAIRPVVAPLFAPNPDALDLSGEETPLSIEEEFSPRVEPNPVRARNTSRTERSRNAENDRIDRPGPRLEDPHLRQSESQPTNSGRVVPERPKEVSISHKAVASASAPEVVKAATHFETRNIERVTETRTLGVQSDPRQDHPGSRRTELPSTAQASSTEAVRPRIEPFVPPTNSSRDRGRVDRVEAASPPTIRVTIGRVDVKLVTAEPAKRPSTPKQESKPTLALEDYLARTGDQR
jgi:hypothetical protein